MPRSEPVVVHHSMLVAHVGGDFHDMWRGPGGETYLAIGDVSGGGQVTADLRGETVRVLSLAAGRGAAPGAALEEANRVLGPELRRRGAMVTALLARWRPEARVLELASAGHMWPYMVNDHGIRELALMGLPLGILEGAHPEVHEIVSPGTSLLLYTDGLVEGTGPGGEMFGFERLAAALARMRGARVHELVRGVVETFEAWAGRGPHRDDVTVLAGEWS